jgi:hypothetical protein
LANRIIYFTFFLLITNAQTIAPEHRINWQRAGLEKGFSLQADHLLNATDSPYAAIPNDGLPDDATMQRLLEEARSLDGLVLIFFPAGDYLFTSQIALSYPEDANTVFQGAGANATFFHFAVGPASNCFRISGEQSNQEVVLSSAIAKGSIVMDNITLGKGWVYLFERDHPQGQGQESGFFDVVGQLNYLEDQTTLRYPVNKDFLPEYGLMARQVHPVRRIGFENFTLIRSDEDHSTRGENFLFIHAVNCWLKGVASNFTSRHHVEARFSANLEISGCYFNDARNHDNMGRGSGIVLGNGTTNSLVLNNIFRRLRHSMLVQAGANGNVFAYNYSRDRYWTESHPDLPFPLVKPGQKGDISVHGLYPFANLFESNLAEYLYADDHVIRIPDIGDFIPDYGVRENGPYNTFLRNRVIDPDGNRGHIVLESTPLVNIIGNELYFNDNAAAVQIINSTLATDIFSDNPLKTHQETENLTQPGIGLSLNDSYYFTSQPLFLAGFDFPPFGPKPNYSGISHTATIPAQVRYGADQKTYNASPVYFVQSSWFTLSGPGMLDFGSEGVFTIRKSPDLDAYQSIEWSYKKSSELSFRDLPLWQDSLYCRVGSIFDFTLKSVLTSQGGNTFSDSVQVFVDLQNAFDDACCGDLSENTFVVFPNPFATQLTMVLCLKNSQKLKPEMYTLDGRKVSEFGPFQRDRGMHSLQLKPGILASGTYVLRVRFSDRAVARKLLHIR